MHLDALSEAEFTTLTHAAFPEHSVRVKRSKFCDESVKYGDPIQQAIDEMLTSGRAYTGYIDVGARHLFFYFFESRNNPSADDVILWTNGGKISSLALEICYWNQVSFRPWFLFGNRIVHGARALQD